MCCLVWIQCKFLCNLRLFNTIFSMIMSSVFTQSRLFLSKWLAIFSGPTKFLCDEIRWLTKIFSTFKLLPKNIDELIDCLLFDLCAMRRMIDIDSVTKSIQKHFCIQEHTVWIIYLDCRWKANVLISTDKLFRQLPTKHAFFCIHPLKMTQRPVNGRRITWNLTLDSKPEAMLCC